MSEIQNKPISDLIRYNQNPKMHPESQIEQLANSIREWGWTVPILIDEQNNVLAGHGRLSAALTLEMEEVPCIVATGWSEEQKSAYVIADNKLAENGEWDMGLYFSELKKINDMGFDVNLIGAEVELDMLNFSPSMDPTTSFADVTNQQVEQAQDNANQNMTTTANNRSLEGVEVVCPSCAHTFRVAGQ
tara:strand:- start:8130 stop:8696 length:567 start_codon:yes stop_codon:yes gene_type:complete